MLFALYSISHDLLPEKLDTYGFLLDAITFFYSCFRRRLQNIKINNTICLFQILNSVVPEGPNFGLILPNIFINDLFLLTSKSDLHNFDDDNTISEDKYIIEKPICTLEKESQAARECIKCNKIIVNPDKFQGVKVKRKRKIDNSYPSLNSEKNV